MHPLGPKFGMVGLFGHMKMLRNFHTNWINQNGTCFTHIFSGQKLAKIPEGKGLDEICPNLVEVVYMSSRRSRKIFRLIEAI